MSNKKTATVILDSIKDSNWWELIRDLGLLTGDDEKGYSPINQEAKKKISKHFDYMEYASIELKVDEDFNIIGGRILPKGNNESSG